ERAIARDYDRCRRSGLHRRRAKWAMSLSGSQAMLPGHGPVMNPTCPPAEVHSKVTCAESSCCAGSAAAGTKGSLAAHTTSVGVRIARSQGLLDALRQ